jgi:uncharacterized protein
MNGLPPRITSVAKPYWEGLQKGEGEIRLQQCDRCKRFVFYPRNHCPYCAGRELLWKVVEESATLYTWTVAEVPVSAAFQHLVRPVLAVADLRGAHLPTTLIETDPQQITIGMQLQPVFDRASYPGITLLRFRALT